MISPPPWIHAIEFLPVDTRNHAIPVDLFMPNVVFCADVRSFEIGFGPRPTPLSGGFFYLRSTISAPGPRPPSAGIINLVHSAKRSARLRELIAENPGVLNTLQIQDDCDVMPFLLGLWP